MIFGFWRATSYFDWDKMYISAKSHAHVLFHLRELPRIDVPCTLEMATQKIAMAGSKSKNQQNGFPRLLPNLRTRKPAPQDDEFGQ